jgi:hypothetical protein
MSRYMSADPQVQVMIAAASSKAGWSEGSGPPQRRAVPPPATDDQVSYMRACWGGGVLDSSCITYRAISHAPPASAFCTHCDVDESCAAASASIDKLQLLGLSGGSWAGGGVFVLAVPLHSPLCPISHAPHSPCLCWGHLQVAVCCRQLLVLAGNVFFCTFAKLHTCCCTAMCCCRLDHGWLVGVMQGDITQCAAVV